MNNHKRVILKPGKEKPAKNKHAWIFSGAIASIPRYTDGDILAVESSTGEFLGMAYFNSKSNITGRFVTFTHEEPKVAIHNHIVQAIELRKILFSESSTTGYRLINAEADGLPGLIVDKYANVLVMQIATLGMEIQKEFIVKTLLDLLQPSSIFEKSNLPSRKQEGLEPFEGLLAGEPVDRVTFTEHGLQFQTSLTNSQKTGFFLDQREMRNLVKSYAQGRTLANCFAYTGAFSVYALAGGAKRVDSVEISPQVKELIHEHITLNNLDTTKHTFIQQDVFDFLRSKESEGYDFIILDPPAFAKSKYDVTEACRGYKDINRLAMKNLQPESLLLTCSCSHFVDEHLFRQVLFQAAAEAGRDVQIITKHILAPDHPVSLYHPEGEYLKSFLLRVK